MTTNTKKELILTGILDKETVLELDHPVYWDYLYVMVLKDGTAKVIVSHIQDSVRRLIGSLVNDDKFDVKEIRRCNMEARNFF